jgi:hypothetical protein
MTYLFVIVGALVFFFCYWRWTKRGMEREERIASFKGKIAICPYRFEPKDIPDQIILKLEPSFPGRIANETVAQPDYKYPCGANLAIAGVWKKQNRKGDIFDCSNCGEVSIWDMDRAPPVLIDYDKPRKPRRPRRQR